MVPIEKKNGQIRVCVDFQDLNNACPKDEFPLLNVDILVDAAAGHERFFLWMVIVGIIKSLWT